MALAIVAGGLAAFGITAVLGFWMIPYLRKLKYGQTILDIGPSWHKKKEGTPTMGGLMFIAGIVAGVVLGCAAMGGEGYSVATSIGLSKLVLGVVASLAFGFIGFVDDYIKVVKKRNLGLTAWQKLAGQFLAAGCYLWGLFLAGDTSTIVIFPLLGQVDFGVLYYPLAAVGLVFMVNSVNLTDGLDGLAASVTGAAALGLFSVAAVFQNREMEIFSIALAAGCLGFLVWNFYPAKVFMGDTGSMFLGGAVVTIAFGLGLPVILGLVGVIYVAESLSVVLQVISFKTTGKRIFRMSPIHHHFEMSGHSEVQIVAAFTAVTCLGAVAAGIVARLMLG